ncbi:MAG: transcription antitermination factor NusB [Thermodesulfovibrionia bacterium]|nr:transcription antitermination factor NusB [Thermodesulfovibrionia bacterium]
MKRRRAREYALQILFQLDVTNNEFSNDLFEDFWEDIKEDEDIKQFSKALVIGTTKNIEKIDEIIKKTTEHWSIERMAIVDRSILRTAVYELLYRSDIPPTVTINEAIEISKKYSTEDSASFINGILDKIQKSEKIAGEQ